MSDPIQRYGLFGQYDEWAVDHDSDGEFVLFTDHTAAIAAARADGVREGMLKAAEIADQWGQAGRPGEMRAK